MRISVALCVYNGERFLGQQLESIGRQTRLPNELIVVDDGSTDSSSEIVADFASRASFPVQLHRNEINLGVSQNFARAIGLCSGEIIATADQDDVWKPEKLARIEAEFARSLDVSLVFSDADLIDGKGNTLGSRLWTSVRFDYASCRQLQSEQGFATLLKRPVITGATMAFRSSFKARILPIAPGWIHDEWIGLMIAADSLILAIPDPLMHYRRHSNNQVGVLGLNASERAKVSLARPGSEFLERAVAFESLRLALSQRLPERSDLLGMVDQKIAHCRARGSLPKRRLARIPKLLRELVSLRYLHYSGNSLASVRDFLAKG